MLKRTITPLQWICSAPGCIRYVGYVVHEGKREIGRYCKHHADEVVGEGGIG